MSRFFIDRLGEEVIGRAWYEGALAGDEPPPGWEAAARWLHPALLGIGYVERVRAAFAEGGEVLHVCLADPLAPERAGAVHGALERARFRRHHHPGYEIDVAPKAEQEARSPLVEWIAWLETREAASFHYWLAGWLLPGRLKIQVQAARARVGDRFPLHEDTGEEGLAAVYNFTRGFGPDAGGVLRFTGPRSGRKIIEAPPRFNSVLLFRPRGAPHEVTAVREAALANVRYTVTAFYLTAP